MKRTKRLFIPALMMSFLLPCLAPAQARPLLRISIENTKDHVQAKSLALFRERIHAKSGAGLDVEIYTDGRLFRDRDVLSALHTGKVEMAVPGLWNLEHQEPNVGVFFLPFMYGRGAEDNHLLSDGKVGREIEKRLKDRNDVEVLGGWLDLGSAHIFTLNRRISSYEDLKGLTIRVAGGKANELRLLRLGARSASIPWTDLAANLRSGSIDGLLTTYETVASAQLWKFGLRNAFEDREYFPMYLPLVSRAFWNRLKESQWNALREAWKEILEPSRKSASEAQETGKSLFIEAGGHVTIPGREDLARARSLLLDHQGDMAKRLGIDAGILRAAAAEVEGRR